MLTVLYATENAELVKNPTREQLAELLRSQKGTLWVDLENPTREEGAILEETFQFHSLCIEDCWEERAYPRVDEYDSYVFAIVHAINPTEEGVRVETTELDFFVGQNYLVTFHRVPLKAVAEVSERCQRNPRHMLNGPDFLAYEVLDAATNLYLPTIDRLTDQLEDAEELALRRPEPSTMNVLLGIKRDVVNLRRILTPQIETVGQFSREQFKPIRPQFYPHFRSVYDLMVRININVEFLREEITSAQAVYLSSIANRTNDVIKVLSIAAAIFLPLTFLVGVYGMNFDNLPELKWRFAYFGVWGIMVAVAVGMVAYFKWRRWI